MNYPIGYRIEDPTSELMGVVKGVLQILKERNIEVNNCVCEKEKYRESINKTKKALWETYRTNRSQENSMALMNIPSAEQVTIDCTMIDCPCPFCVLSAQIDFLYQKTALEETYEEFNKKHGTNHRCILLPKFHPELNPIERCWARMKWFTRRHSDGTLAHLQELMKEGLGKGNLPLAMIRRFTRLSKAYLLAYSKNMDIVQADKWIRKHRSHRRVGARMDAEMEKLYGINKDDEEDDDLLDDVCDAGGECDFAEDADDLAAAVEGEREGPAVDEDLAEEERVLSQHLFGDASTVEVEEVDDASLEAGGLECEDMGAAADL